MFLTSFFFNFGRKKKSKIYVNLVIICFAGTKWKHCTKINCDRSETRTEFKLEIDWDCSGKLTTITKVTDKNEQTHEIENASNCHGLQQCQMPDCPDTGPCPCQAGKKVILPQFYIQLVYKAPLSGSKFE
jgi:hypothetical protein